MTLRELACEVLEYAGKSTAPAALLPGGESYELYVKAKRWCNYAAQEMADFGPWPWMVRSFVDVDLTSGEFQFDLPEDVHRLAGGPSYENGAFVLFEPATIERIKELRARTTTPGVSSVWALGWNHGDSRRQLIVWPPPSSNNTVSVPYVKLLPTLEDDEAVFPIPPNLHEIIGVGAIALWEEREQKNWASGARQRFNTKVAEAFSQSKDLGSGGIMPMRAHSHFI